jgi:hypothetical protein
VLLEGHRAVVLLVAVGACAGDDAAPREITRIDGLTVGGELGFRFGEPLDIDGDGELDIVAGSRRGGANGYGEASVWSHGEVILHWESDELDALFGHGALAVPDSNGDGTPDIVITAPNALGSGHVDTYSGRDGSLLWSTPGAMYDGFGWQVARAPDLDGDGFADLWVGAPSNPAGGHVYLVSGHSGSIVQTIDGPGNAAQFGWYLTALGSEVVIGAPTEIVDGESRGAVHVVSADGTERLMIPGEIIDHQFGEMLASLDDLDGDGTGELAVAAVGGGDTASQIPSEVSILSGATGERLHLLNSNDPGELYGRMLVAVPDMDGDGIRELAVGCPWWNGRDGRIENRSPRDYSVLADLHGDEDGWLGWHIAPAGDDGMLASQLHARADTGALELFELR